MTVDAAIPNNVGLDDDARTLKEMQRWRSQFRTWWRALGPVGIGDSEVYLRTAISGDPDGWAHYDFVRLADYRFGVFFTPSSEPRHIGFGTHAGKPAWQEVPEEARDMLFRIIVSQSDTEPAAVEQQRRLAACAPSTFDLRNMLQVSVEEARHMWSMVYLLLRHFGTPGRDEVERLMERRSGDASQPRMLEIFNERLDDWLSFFVFTAFADRDGKYQLNALAEGGFDPLARAARFMLCEETHHVSVGTNGIERILERSAELARRDPNEDVAAQGGIPIAVVQRYINFWYPRALDMLGGEISSNAARAFAGSIKGSGTPGGPRKGAGAPSLTLDVPDGDRLVGREVPLAQAINEVMRDEYVRECERVMARWNRVLEQYGLAQRLALPHRRFNRRRGVYAKHHFDCSGRILTAQQWQTCAAAELPTAEDEALLRRLMEPVGEAGRAASWIAPPKRSIDGKPLEFLFVRK
jgi:benzoyl-CoA 2,3-dioxygenase component B